MTANWKDLCYDWGDPCGRNRVNGHTLIHRYINKKLNHPKKYFQDTIEENFVPRSKSRHLPRIRANANVTSLSSDTIDLFSVGGGVSYYDIIEMGVKELWTILSPVCEKKPLWQLENKVIAIDLSAWICDSSTFYASHSIVNSYLRNLFFRTCYLLLLGAKPVFILEGKAPHLKADTIRNRLNSRGQEREKQGAVVSRSRLSSLQKQCEELLSALGVKCIKAPGEAEAYCAYLNYLGIADGVITQDSDVFLYGAREVFRNFQMSPHFTCDWYSMDVIEKKLGLTRTKLVGYSLLVGCDYSSGVQKINKQDAVEFVVSIADSHIIQRFVEWRNDDFEKSSKTASDLEVQIRNKCIQDESFPDLEIVTEFMSEQSEISFVYAWSQPSLSKFVGLAVRKLAWEEDYAIKKFIPLLARWHLLNPFSSSDLKITNIIGVPTGKKSFCYKVEWNSYDLITTEPKELIATAYPQLVAQYEESKVKKKRTIRNVKKKTTGDNKQVNNELIAVGQEDGHLNPDQNVSLNVEENQFNVSAIINDIVSRVQSNPAILKLSSNRY